MTDIVNHIYTHPSKIRPQNLAVTVLPRDVPALQRSWRRADGPQTASKRMPCPLELVSRLYIRNSRSHLPS
jgi:hypothetical protein